MEDSSSNKKRRRSRGQSDGSSSRSRSPGRSTRSSRSARSRRSRSAESKIPAAALPVSGKSLGDDSGELQSGKGRSRKKESPASLFFLWIGRLIVLAMVMIAPWCLGSVSQTAQSWMMILAVAGLTMWWFSMAFGSRSTQLFPYLAFPVILGLILVGLQMMPLNDGVSKVIAPRQSELYDKYSSPVTGELLENTADPIAVNARVTMDVDGTAKMFNLLLLALICLILGCHFFSSRRIVYLLPIAITINGMAISAMGMVQRLSGDSTIYGLVLEHIGQPFGPFVNKNNAAGYLLICLSGSLALLFGTFNRRGGSRERPRKIITTEYPIWKQISLHIGVFLAELNASKLMALLATLVITLGILFTVSRGGILALGIGFASATVYYCLLRKSSLAVFGVLFSFVLLVGLLGFLGMGDQITRKLGSLSDAELLTNDERANHWVQTAPAIGEFSPLGSGLGSYLNVHRLYRLDDEKKVFYFAENQYFQTLVETGIIGIFLLMSALVVLGLCIRFLALRGNSPKTGAICLMGMFLLPSQMAAAVFDFGLFIPANTILMATACGFIAGQAHSLADRLKKNSSFRFGLPRFFALTLMLVVFSVSLFSMISCRRYAALEQSMGSNPQTETYVSMDLATTEQRIENLKVEINDVPDANGLLRLAELYLYRYRIRLFDALVDNTATLDARESEELDRVWLFSTGVDRLHRMVYQAWQSGDQTRLQTLITDPLVKEHLIPAVYYLKLSRSRSPLNPSVHVLLAQLHAVSPEKDADLFHLQRSLELAPANATIALICGILNLQAGRTQAASENLHKCLQIDPRNYKQVIAVAVPFLSPEQIADEILLDQPLMLHNFATTYMASKSVEPLKFTVFRRIVELLDEGQQWDRKSLKVKAELQEELGDLDAAIETQKLAIDLYPSVLRLRHELVNLLVKRGDIKEAMDITRYLLKNARGNNEFEQLYKKVRRLEQQQQPNSPGARSN